MRVEQGEGIEELALPEGLVLNLGQLGLVADVVPMGVDDVELMVDDLLGLGPGQVIGGGALDATIWLHDVVTENRETWWAVMGHRSSGDVHALSA